MLKIHDKIWQIALPQPYYEPTNVYLIKDKRTALIDTGHPASFSKLKKVLQAAGLDFSNIDLILSSHSHVDHIGGNIYLSDAAVNDIPVCAIHSDVLSISNLWQLSHEGVHKLIYKIRNDVAAYQAMFSLSETETFANRCFPVEGEVCFQQGLKNGQNISLGTITLKVFETPGHNPFHICLYDEINGILFSGDLMLREGTSIIDAMGDNHTHYLDSLNLIEGLNSRIVLPSHGKPFYSTQVAVKIAKRLYYFIENSIIRVLDRPKSAYEITKTIFGPYLNQIEYAFIGYARVCSYLNYLIQKGVIEVVHDQQPVPLYHRVNQTLHNS